MADLDPIIQEIIIEEEQALAAIERLIAQGKRLVDVIDDDIARIEAFQASIDSLEGKTVDIDVRMPGGLSAFVAALNDSTGAAKRVVEVSREGTASLLTLDEAVQKVGGGFERQIWAINGTAAALQAVGNDGNSAGGGILAAGAAAGAADRSFRLWGTGIRVTGYGIHWLIAGTLELAAVVIPALIAAGAAVGAAAEGATWAMDRLKATFAATEATSAMIGKTTGQVLGLKSSLQQAQTQADPLVWEAFGGAINGVRNSFGGFWQEGDKVLQVLDRFIAEVDLGLSGSLGGEAQAAISHMTADLAALGEVLGNVGHIILNLATAMPGLAEVILGLLAGLTRLLSVLTQPAWWNFHGMLIMMAIGLEEAGRWGGLLFRVLGPMASGLGRLIGTLGWGTASIARFGAGMEAVGGELSAAGAMTRSLGGTFRMLFTTIPGWSILAVAAIGILTFALMRASDWLGRLTSQIEAQTPGNALASILQQLPKLQSDLAAVHPVQARMTGDMNQSRAAADGAAESQAVYTGQLSAYRGTISRLVGDAANILGMNTHIGKSYFSLSQAIGLATAAGVQVNHMFNANGTLSAVAKQQIMNLVSGYQALAQTGNTLYGDIQAINVQTLVQQTDVSKLNQAWDSYMQNLTGGTGALAGLKNDLQTIGNITLPQATSQIRAFSQGSNGMTLSTAQISKALLSFSGTSAQVWQNYNAALSQAQQVTDYLRTAASEGAFSMTSQYTGAIKGVVAQLLPFAKNSKTAAAELSGLAFQATGTTMTYQQMVQWVGNTKDAQKTLNGTIQQATQYMSNLNVVAANLSTTLATAVDQAISNGVVNITAIANAAQRFNNQLRTGVQGTPQFTSALKGMVQQLLDANTPGNDVVAILDQLARRSGYGKGQIQGLNKEIQNLISELNSIPNIKRQVVIQYSSTGQPTGGAVQGGGHIVLGQGTAGFASGGRVPGFGGGDRHLALLEGGEAVVPKHLVPRISGFLGAHGVPGFKAGGVIGPGGSVPPAGAQTPMEKVMAQWGREVWHELLHKHGRHHPIAMREMEDLLGMTKPGKGAIWHNPQYRKLEHDLHDDLFGYAMKDLSYWHAASKLAELNKEERKRVASLEKAITHADALGETAKAHQLEKLLMRTLTGDRIKRADLDTLLGVLLDQMGYGSRLPVGMFDNGGYLPPGMSLAINNTGRPEPVGPAGPSVLHVHLEMGGQEFANAVVPSLVGGVNRYSYRNSGRATGILRPS